MKTNYLLSLACFLLAGSALLAASLPFVSDPSLSPDGQTVVFSYNNDLWKVPTEGGTALRLTAMEGREFLPRFSPDGQWIAFSATLDGNTNIYLMPSEGGEIRQLSFHQSTDLLDSWSWDSRYLYFSSPRYNYTSTYKLSIEGGTPERLFGYYHAIPHHMTENPVDGSLVFTESWESYAFSHRLGYRGAHRPDLLSYNPATDTFQSLTHHEGKDMWPSFDRSGILYFVSDEGNGHYNLYRFDEEGNKLALTQFESPVGRPQASADGSRIAFVRDYRLHIYDVASGRNFMPEIRLSVKNTLGLDQLHQIRGNITWFDVSPDQKKLAFVSRGELFVSDAEGKFIRQIKTKAGERVVEVKWTADSRELLISRTRDGWTNLFLIAADGSSSEMALTHADATQRLISLNNDRSMAVFLSGRNHIKLLDLNKRTHQVLAEDELWGFQNSPPGFSPDGRYVVYTVFRNFEQNIMLHPVQGGDPIALTQSGVSERMPSWSACGDYVYFVSDRIQPNYPRGITQDRIYRIPLQRRAPELRSQAFDALFAPQDSVKNNITTEVKIDTERLDERWESVQLARIGRQWSPQVFRVSGTDYLLFSSNHDKGEWALYIKELHRFEDKEVKKIENLSPGMGPLLVQSKDQLYVLASGNIHKLNPAQAKAESITLSHGFSRNLAEEFSQIFYETWAAIDENFYDENFHGLDWQAVRDNYARHLPGLKTREDLRRLINDMLGELNASHMGFSSSGDEEKAFYAMHTAETGLIWSEDDPFVAARIIRNSNLDLSETPVQKGDRLIKVNGKEAIAGSSRDALFYFAEFPEELNLVFRRGNQEFEVRTRPHRPGQISSLLYDEWIYEKRNHVTEASGGKLAYVFMKDMGPASLDQFLIDMSSHAMDKQGLILDIRYNRGGNVHDDVLQFLSRRPYLSWKYRGGSLAPQPNFSPSANPMVLLINERSLSDAEMTAEGFKRLGLGKIIGTETYRWIIFTSGKSMVDGSFCRIPAWGCYTLDGDNLELTGVAPDIDVFQSFHDRISGRDPILERALRELLQQPDNE